MQRKQGFEELFLPQLDAAYNLAYWIVGGEHDAQDIVQESYFRALKGFSGFRGGNPRAWLLTIVRNTAYSWIKKKQRTEERLIPLDEQIHVAPLEIAPSEQFFEKRHQVFEQALKRLPAEFRESLMLFEVEGWSYKAIAAALGVPVGTVMSRLSRARRRLREELTNCQDAVPSWPDTAPWA
ncbi:MAG TPA: sigma-70 family RNA polymerase sigma factor [Chthoniobacterales bacterium]|nr:sigma-70 family RNA polymerase sigma factor [Chthoniobacterales bacterium]